MSKTTITSGGITADAIDATLIADDAISEEHIDATVITGSTALAATPADTDELLISDAGTIKRIDYSYIKSANTPSFYAALASNQSINASTYTKLLLATESWDTNSAFASNKFTVPTGEGGKYHIGFSIGTEAVMDNVERVIGKLYVNGGAQNHTTTHMWAPGDNLDLFINFSTILNLDADEYVELYAYQIDASPQNMVATYTRMWGFKLIGV